MHQLLGACHVLYRKHFQHLGVAGVFFCFPIFSRTRRQRPFRDVPAWLNGHAHVSEEFFVARDEVDPEVEKSLGIKRAQKAMQEKLSDPQIASCPCEQSF